MLTCCEKRPRDVANKCLCSNIKILSNINAVAEAKNACHNYKKNAKQAHRSGNAGDGKRPVSSIGRNGD